MKLVRNNGKKINHVVVPKELEPFVEYMFRRGYSEITIAGIVSDLKYIMSRGLTEKELELATGKTARRLRYAWRHYKKFQSLVEAHERKNSSQAPLSVAAGGCEA